MSEFERSIVAATSQRTCLTKGLTTLMALLSVRLSVKIGNRSSHNNVSRLEVTAGRRAGKYCPAPARVIGAVFGNLEIFGRPSLIVTSAG